VPTARGNFRLLPAGGCLLLPGITVDECSDWLIWLQHCLMNINAKILQNNFILTWNHGLTPLVTIDDDQGALVKTAPKSWRRNDAWISLLPIDYIILSAFLFSFCTFWVLRTQFHNFFVPRLSVFLNVSLFILLFCLLVTRDGE